MSNIQNFKTVAQILYNLTFISERPVSGQNDLSILSNNLVYLWGIKSLKKNIRAHLISLQMT